jgi:hypothetical protein
LAILIVLLGLRAYIRMLERNSNTSEGTP